MSTTYINGRFLTQPLSGVQRYARGILEYLPSTSFQAIRPQQKGRFAGLRWEHFNLPRTLRAKGDPLLLNFCNTAPLTYPDQIVTIHDLAALEHPEWFRPSFAAFYKRLIPAIITRSRHVVTVSEWTKKQLMDRFDLLEDEVSVIPPGVNTTLLNAREGSLEITSPFLLMVGSLDPRKRFAEAAKALLPLLSSLGLQLVIAGNKGSSFRKVELPSSKALKFIEHPTDGQLKWLYTNAELLIQPSMYEGFSMVPMEALSLGTPALISDIEVHREVYGDGVEYFPVGEVGGLGEYVSKVLGDSGSGLVRLRRIRVPSKYSFTKSAGMWVELARRFANA